MRSNFTFLKDAFPLLYKEAVEAEQLALVSPKAGAVLCRSALEAAVQWLYANDPDLEEPYDTTLSALMHEPSFRNSLKPSMFREINLIRKHGNNAAHGKQIKRGESLVALKNLFRFLGYVALYYGAKAPDVPVFDEALIPDGHQKELREAELRKLEEELSARNAQARAERERLEEQAKTIESLRKELEAQQQIVKERKAERVKTVNEETALPLLVSEQTTRKQYIDAALKECGWDNLKEGSELEYEVTGMPRSTNASGIGYVDYVLWGENGLPLAVIEAKRTMADARKGKHQAKLYADCLEAMHGQRPVIFYTNGFETYLWDDQFYPEREVSGFYTRDELQRLIDRRSARQDIRAFQPEENITDRYYQKEAIQRVAESFAKTAQDGTLTGGQREALLVMATGSGKTRTAVSIVDMLTRNGWVKRVLFLADRNALVSQAKRSFGELLPQLSSVDLTRERENAGTRLVFSTYPTMLNKIDQSRTDDVRNYTPGHFDLIIIDEAHRSVYAKYGAIFEYFDSLLIGLTATPKKDIDRNTYELFGIEDDNPTFAYELDQAVKDQYLVPPKAIDVPTPFTRDGIKYHELSERDKQEYEEKFGDPTQEEVPDEISGQALNTWLFNTGTVDAVLNYMMTYGIKSQGGDQIGKTIIFAKNHKHAVFIEERFNKLYPEYRGDFLRVIDNHESKAQDLLERFCDPHKEKLPQIAVSVDMMDTGVDAPRVVNLVFFKPVKSFAKFWQMIGRGTRLYPDLFGPGQDKQHFMLFDFCGNLEFFDEHPDGLEASKVKGLTQRIFELKLDVVMLIRDLPESNEHEQAVEQSYTSQLHKLVLTLDQERFVVKRHLRHVVEYSHRERWNNLSLSDTIDIKNELAHLIVPDKNETETARRFDIMMLMLIVAELSGKDGSNLIHKVGSIGRALSKKQTIPAVAARKDTLQKVQTPQFWQQASVKTLDAVREELRDLVQYLDVERQADVYTTLQDEIDVSGVKEHNLIKTSQAAKPYRERVEAYIRKNKHHLTIIKLRNNEPITEAELTALEEMLFDGDERGTKADFVAAYGDQPLSRLIREIVGLDVKAAKQAFAEFLSAGQLSANQITFIDKIINFLEHNGVIDPRSLFEPPFTDQSDLGLSGVFDDSDSRRIISIVKQINRNAEVGA